MIFMARGARYRRLTAPRPAAKLNLVVQHQHLDRTFAALADPTRRRVLETLGRGPASIGELAEPAGMSLTGMKKHVAVLEEAGLVRTEKVGRVRRVELGPAGLDDVQAWVAAHRAALAARLDRFGAMLERDIHDQTERTDRP
jgi:DNA-binding transcriptional ArsR family regulator